MQQPLHDSLVEEELEPPPQLPLTDGRYFACRRCRRILSEAQWFSTGCIECSATMGTPDRDSLLDFATPHFHNFVGLIAPGQSWVARLIMKSRTSTNGVFAETLSDNETDEDEEQGEDDVMGERYGDERALEKEVGEAHAVEDSMERLLHGGGDGDDDDVGREGHHLTSAPAVSAAPADVATTTATAALESDSTNEAGERAVKRVKVEADALLGGVNA